MTDVAVTVELLIRGGIQAPDESGNLHRYAGPHIPLIATTAAAVAVLVTADVLLIRPGVRRDL